MFGKTVATEKSIAEKSADFLKTFKETADGLRGVNNEAQIIISQNEEQIKTLQAENNDLENIAAKNSQVIQNIENIIAV